MTQLPRSQSSSRWHKLDNLQDSSQDCHCIEGPSQAPRWHLGVSCRGGRDHHSSGAVQQGLSAPWDTLDIRGFIGTHAPRHRGPRTQNPDVWQGSIRTLGLRRRFRLRLANSGIYRHAAAKHTACAANSGTCQKHEGRRFRRRGRTARTYGKHEAGRSKNPQRRTTPSSSLGDSGPSRESSGMQNTKLRKIRTRVQALPTPCAPWRTLQIYSAHPTSTRLRFRRFSGPSGRLRTARLPSGTTEETSGNAAAPFRYDTQGLSDLRVPE